MKARCAHGAPWWREDCPDYKDEPGPVRSLFVERPRPWWGWSDGYAFWCGPCGASLEHGVTHNCPGEAP